MFLPLRYSLFGVLVFTVTVGLWLQGALAEESLKEPSRGHMPDGRAFRTDAQGNQLVDYVAELELSIETLNRQVANLQNELETKDKIIEGLRRRSPGLVERDLVGSSRNTIKSAALLEAKEQRLEEVEEELAQTRKELERLRLEQAEDRKSRQVLVEELAKERNQKKAERQQLQPPLINSPRKEILPKKQTSSALVKTKNQPSFVAKLNANEETLSVPVATPSQPKMDESWGRGNQAGALTTLRAQVQSDINRVRGLIMQRNSAYARYRRWANPISFVPRKAVSRRGLDIASISRELRFSRGLKEVSAFSTDVSEIELKVSEDLETLRRLTR